MQLMPLHSRRPLAATDGASDTSEPLLTRLADRIRQFGCLFIFFGVAVAANLGSYVLSAMVRNRISAEQWQKTIGRLFQVALFLFARTGVLKLEIQDREILQGVKGCIVAANHPALIDAVILLSLLPSTVCIMRADLARNPAYSSLARLAGYVTNDSGLALVREGSKRIQSGQNLLIFPEGTRTTDLLPVNTFKKGFSLLATHARTPIQTVFIEREGAYFSKAVGMFGVPHFPIQMKIRAGALIEPREGESAGQLAARMEEYFRLHLVNDGHNVRYRDPSVI